DLSFNNFSGDLPNSFSSLSNLSTLYLQSNQLTGSVNVLVDLPLGNLNLANNSFSGWIPRELNSIPNLIFSGNSFANGPAPPPPPYTSPPPSRSRNNHSHTGPYINTPGGSNGQYSNSDRNKGLAVGPIIGISLGSVFVVLFVMVGLIFCIRRCTKNKHEKESSARASVGNSSMGTDKVSINTEVREQRIRNVATIADMKPLPAETLVGEREHGTNGSAQKVKSPITATSYTVASLQTATNSFSQECLVGEGSLGRVYRAEFSTGKILAVKKMDSAALSLQEEDNFLEAVSNMSRLRHPNIITLVGYCAEHGQRLLVYDYIETGTLHDLLHFADDSSNILSWNARVKVALGSARALEYLHEVCLPSVVHRNFKSANILVDEELNPHLSDCGLAALAPNTERQVSSQMVGSFGYSAPEFAMSGIYTVKSDVYSFGVVMLELLTGRKPLDSSRVRSEQSLVRWATPQLHDIDALAKMVDPTLKGIYPAKSLSRFADVIALCVQVHFFTDPHEKIYYSYSLL
ncbi:Kinase, partial [Thalictrum thalictroides]